MPRAHAAHAPARPTHPAFDSFLRPPATEEGKKSNSGSRASLAWSGAWLRSTESTAGSNKKDAANAASFLFFFSSSVTHALAHRHRETVEGGTGAAGRTVGAMDGAIEPPWPGSRRVLPAAPVPALQKALQDQTKRTRQTPRPFCFSSVRQ
ncbi:unnamed protein product [Stenotrophomonas maltophilia]|nr:unnamed protein product [Stenotrophomonas maltophilia]